MAEEDLVAIPEILDGVGYRSRLECRWKIFFASLGIEVEYEPHPVRVAGRNRWVDFWMVRQQIYAEIKPWGVPIDDVLATAIAEERRAPLCWISGLPRWGEYSISLANFGGLKTVEGLCWGLGRRDKSRLWLTDATLENRFALPVTRDSEGDVPRVTCARLREAYRAAMGWRFDEVER